MGVNRTQGSQRLDPRIDELAAEYVRAEEEIAALISAVIAGGAAAAALDAIAGIVEDLLLTTAEWANTVMPVVYASGLSATIAAMNAEEVGPNHDDASDLFLDDLLDATRAVAQGVLRDARSAVREAERARLLPTREEAQRVADALAEKLEKAGFRYVDRAGKRWKLKSYMRMLLVTQCVAARNYAVGLAAMEAGSPGVRISDGHSSDTDEPCREANGQAWSIAYFLEHPYEHPQCTRQGEPLAPGTDVELDRS